MHDLGLYIILMIKCKLIFNVNLILIDVKFGYQIRDIYLYHLNKICIVECSIVEW